MYLKRMIYENSGPIKQADVSSRFHNDGSPIPLIIVGKNGSGKSLFLSNIVDAFYELAGKKYTNVIEKEPGGNSKYYKIINPNQITIGSNHLVSYLEFEEGKELLKYVYKSGKIEPEQFYTRNGIDDGWLQWEGKTNFKTVEAKEEVVDKAFSDSIVAFFSPSRYEKPNWLRDVYHYDSYFTSETYYNGELKNRITANCDSSSTLNWLFDVLSDAKAELLKDNNSGKYSIEYPRTSDIDLLNTTKTNVEKILSSVLGQSVFLRMGYRVEGSSRLRILRQDGETIMCPSLDSLSTGELALFNLFVTIVRYADREDINLSIKLNEIKGIVVIDEVELHLHSSLQYEVLPRLIRLFPKVQFIISTHSPLFLLGMRNVFGEDEIDIIEMPTATKIGTEGFAEFDRAYNYFCDTYKYSEALNNAIKSKTEKPLIVTEGSTDWKHFKAALFELKTDERCSSWIKELDFEFLEYESLNSKKCDDGKLYIQMSCSELCKACESFSKFPNNKKIIFIADNDDKKTIDTLAGKDNSIKHWGNNVYSFCLPIPIFRQENPEICVELLYPDEQIKKEVTGEDGVQRRLFLGNEFDDSGHLILGNESFFCHAVSNKGERKPVVLDGSGDKKVIKLGDLKTNYALPKASFANKVLNKERPFDRMDFSGFIPVFEKIRDIIAIS